MTGNSWTATTDLAAAYARHASSLRGALRHALVARALAEHLPPGPQRILDVGGGSALQAIILARAGHHVNLVDPDPDMLAAAEQNLAREDPEVRARVQLVAGRGEDSAQLVGDGFDAGCCHGVLPYLQQPAPLVAALVSAVRPGGLVSVLAKNAHALAMRPGLEGRWADALAVMDSRDEIGNLGVPTRADTVAALDALLTAAGATTTVWYGVRVFTDHLRDMAVGADFDHVCELEWRAGCRDPYRQVARLLHLLAVRNPT